MISADHLTQIADDICLSLFDGSEPETDHSSVDAPTRTVTAVVDISGDWNGKVSVSCERATAILIASVMFATPGPELSSSDVHDALGEFANMAGGAVKGMLDGEKTLGLPTVGEGVDLVMVAPNTTKLADVDYQVSTGDKVHLAVHQANT